MDFTIISVLASLAGKGFGTVELYPPTRGFSLQWMVVGPLHGNLVPRTGYLSLSTFIFTDL